jgi:O-acetyl-ADP-ribose deacetylase (regulator of RNase III)
MLLRLVTQYVAKRQALEPWEDASGASHLEIQKLMYFASHFEPKLALEYAPGRYGPYSERVRHLVQEMEGTFLEGFGDGNNPVLELNPIAPTSSGLEKSDAYLATHATIEEATINKVLQLIEGFESPYGTELLASTHWVMSRQDATDPHTAALAVRQWTQRKGRIYTDEHVRVAFEHLTRHEAAQK